MAGGEARPETRRGSREDARERERVELEARSVIRQVGIHIYRVVKSIGVSVSRVSCKERVVGMRCELIERGRETDGQREREGREGEDGERTNDRASYLGVGPTEIENGKPLSLYPYFPFDPFCCFATLLQPLAAHPPPIPSPPPPATARIQSLHINPAHNSHFPVWATLRFGCFSYPRRRSEREGE